MNANKRMKYASTPTYGMQKRGFFKKAAPAPAPMPDFTQIPMQNNGEAPFMSFPPAMFSQEPGAAPYPPFAQSPPFAQNQNIPYMQGQIPPMFSQQPFSMSGVPFQAQALYPPPSMPPPLGNSPFLTKEQGQSAPPPMMQGFVPPLRQQFPAGQPQPMMPPQNAVAPVPFQQPGMNPQFAPPPMAGQFGGQPYPAMPAPPFAQQPPIPSMGSLPMGTAPQDSAPMTMPSMPYAPAQTAPTPLSFHDKLWMGFLFGVLPLLFVGCLLMPTAFDFLRYAFIALSVVGLSAIWYRQMFSSSTRMTVSIIFATLCVVMALLLLGGNTDIQSAGQHSAGADTGVEATESPEGMPGAADPLAMVQETQAPPMQSGPSEAELRLKTFMDLWSSGNKAPEMVAYVQPSWASAKENPTAELFTALANRTPMEYEIEEISGTDADNSRTVTMTADINKNNGKEPVRYRFMIIMNKEGGEWYVDPSSLATNDTEATPDPNARATPVSQMTMAPRMTETPVPPANTTLYYNLNGGAFYHADAYCPRIKKEFLPLEGTFAYGDLRSYNSKLQPCLECNAPIKPLDE